MPWVRIDDHFDEHPKLARVGPLGIAMWVAGLAYCNRNLTDGFIPRSTAHSLLGWEREEDDGTIWSIGVSSGHSGRDADCRMVAGWLVEAGLWENVQGGYRVHDYLEYQPSKEAVLAERENARERQSRSRSRRMSQRDSQRDTVVNSDAPVPVPTPVPVSPPQDSESHDSEVAPAKPSRPRRTRKRTERDDLTEAIGRAWRPALDWDALTETEQAACGRCSAELHRVRATPHLIARAKRAWDASPKWRDLTFTPDALKKHWGELQHIADTLEARTSNGFDPNKHMEVELPNGGKFIVTR